HSTAASNTPYAFSVSATCPLEYEVELRLNWTCNEGYSGSTVFDLMVGDPLYQPMGPDAYGYMAYDVNDDNGPTFSWIEIDPTYGGAGTLINYTSDDQTVEVNLPFTFQYYGQAYNLISVCNNGWIAMGSSTETDYSNSAIPDADGPAAMIAPFWEDLSPQLLGHVAYYYDAANHYFVVEFDSVRQYTPTSALETFEVVLYDPVHYPTLTGDGQILFQYNQISDPYTITVGIENPAETTGLQVLFDGTLDSHMPMLAPGIAILFTTPTSTPNLTVTLTPESLPIVIPATGGSFNYNIAVANNETSQVIADVWCDMLLPNGRIYGPVLGPVSLTMYGGFTTDRNRMQNIPNHAPAGDYSFNAYMGLYPNVAWATDSFPFSKSATGNGALVSDWENSGESFETASAEVIVPDQVTLSQNYPNPFNPLTTISYGLPQNGFVSIKVFDLLGREIGVLVDGYRSAGIHQVTWDASTLSSGVYFYILRVGESTTVHKCLLMK
ncbi:MAG: T9SS type A sorting domain-containing protein, partial [bacterium]